MANVLVSNLDNGAVESVERLDNEILVLIISGLDLTSHNLRLFVGYLLLVVNKELVVVLPVDGTRGSVGTDLGWILTRNFATSTLSVGIEETACKFAAKINYTTRPSKTIAFSIASHNRYLSLAIEFVDCINVTSFDIDITTGPSIEIGVKFLGLQWIALGAYLVSRSLDVETVNIHENVASTSCL